LRIDFSLKDAGFGPALLPFGFDFLWVVFGHAIDFLVLLPRGLKEPTSESGRYKNLYYFLAAFLTLRGFAGDFFCGLERRPVTVGGRYGCAQFTVSRLAGAFLRLYLQSYFLFGGCG